MAWQEGIQQGSYRDAEFFTDSHTFNGGRRVNSVDFPGRDYPYNEDLGRKRRGFSFNVYVLGDDYFDKRDKLKTALEQKGAGKLVHPYGGVYSVVVETFNYTEETAKGRIAKFSIEFVEDVQEQKTTVTPHPAKNLQAKKIAALNAISNDFVRKYPKKFTLMSALKTAQAAIEAGTACIDNAKAMVSSVAEYRKQVERMNGKIIEMSLMALDLAKETQSLIAWGADPLGMIKPTAETAWENFKELTEVVKNTQDIVRPDTIGGRAAKEVDRLITRSSIVTAAGLTNLMVQDSAETGEATRSTLFTSINEAMDDPALSDEVFSSLSDLKIAVDEAIKTMSTGTSFTENYSIPETSPVLVVSQEVHGGVTEADKIASRNNIFHPGFCIGSQLIKVVR